MRVFLHCECQSRMIVVDGVAHCRNGSCKHFDKQFVAPNLELVEVGAHAEEHPAPAAPAATEPELPPAA